MKKKKIMDVWDAWQGGEKEKIRGREEESILASLFFSALEARHKQIKITVSQNKVSGTASLPSSIWEDRDAILYPKRNSILLEARVFRC